MNFLSSEPKDRDPAAAADLQEWNLELIRMADGLNLAIVLADDFSWTALKRACFSAELHALGRADPGGKDKKESQFTDSIRSLLRGRLWSNPDLPGDLSETLLKAAVLLRKRLIYYRELENMERKVSERMDIFAVDAEDLRFEICLFPSCRGEDDGAGVPFFPDKSLLNKHIRRSHSFRSSDGILEEVHETLARGWGTYKDSTFQCVFCGVMQTGIHDPESRGKDRAAEHKTDDKNFDIDSHIGRHMSEFLREAYDQASSTQKWGPRLLGIEKSLRSLLESHQIFLDLSTEPEADSQKAKLKDGALQEIRMLHNFLGGLQELHRIDEHGQQALKDIRGKLLLLKAEIRKFRRILPAEWNISQLGVLDYVVVWFINVTKC
ncbi:hypothetical protein BJ508DRAFT_351295 [Ascobolus immersus RN42]|uniref:Uncharacterized protein n=1 Tax=Ascobolus immersus RN42 TaxID=1160509 RepID=A0A3N4HU17_ASCIM|nr:hypothetical protein BJ508DRAFT_351295 [Ascobolus immersus RN42]